MFNHAVMPYSSHPVYVCVYSLSHHGILHLPLLCSGPENLNISSKDRSIATTSKVSEVGVYKFKVVVKDANLFSDDSEITITVKKRNVLFRKY